MESRDDWDQHWNQYAKTAAQNPAQQMRQRLVAGLLVRGGLRAGAKVLDIGSGQGDFCELLCRICPGAELVGFELSQRGVEVSRRKVPAAQFHVVDLFNPPVEAQQYRGWAGHAVCSEVLEHVDSPMDFLRAARDFLADGSRLIVTVPGGPMSAFDRHIGHRQHFTKASVTRLLESAGFKVEKVHLAGFPFFNLYRLAVILRGKKLIQDGDGTGTALATTPVASLVMMLFRALFRFNLPSCPWGWQVVAVARKV